MHTLTLRFGCVCTPSMYVISAGSACMLVCVYRQGGYVFSKCLRVHTCAQRPGLPRAGPFSRTPLFDAIWRKFTVLARGGGCTQAECVRALKRLALPRVSHFGEIAPSGSRRLRSMLAVAPVLFAHAIVTVV